MNGPLPRRTIGDLKARYEMKPHFRDVYVEGPTDVRIFRRFLSEFGLSRDVAVYPIETVDVPILKLDLIDSDSDEGDGGNKARVVSLALALTENGEKDCDQVTCIADADFDHFLGKKYPTTSLLLTDFTSMELYLFGEDTVSKVTSMYCGEKISSAAALLEVLRPVLIDLFTIRLTAVLLKMNIPWLTPEKCCVLNDDKIAFDSNQFVHKFLSKGNSLARKAEFEHELSKIRENPVKEVRNAIRGHDFISLLNWYLRKRCNKYTLDVMQLR